MRLTVLGGSAWSTPALLRGIGESPAPPSVRLWGRSAERLRQVARASSLLAPSLDIGAFAEAELPAALDRADVVLIQVRVGGLSGRAHDEAFPLPFGICGDEGLGPGGLAAAWRTWPVLKVLLKAIARHCPDATILLLTSPTGALTRLARTRFPGLSTFGICELPWSTFREVGSPSGSKELEFCYVGVNHLGWLYALTGPESDAGPWWTQYPDTAGFPCPELVRRIQAIPTKYMEMHYHHPEVLDRQLNQDEPRGRVLEDYARVAFSAFATGDTSTIQRTLAMRPTPWYEDCVAPMVATLASGASGGPFFLTVRNDGLQTSLPRSAFLEHPHWVRHGVFEPVATTTPPPTACTRALVPYLQYEDLAVTALSERTDVALRMALAKHPWVERHGVPNAPRGLAGRILSQSDKSFD